jgi:hypothetical protein
MFLLDVNLDRLIYKKILNPSVNCKNIKFNKLKVILN